MKAILEFNLPEESLEHRLALDGSKWKAVCQEIDQWLRSLEKHSDQDTVSASKVRGRLREELDSYELYLE